MNLDELRSVRDTERASGELQALRASFYEEARDFIEDLEAERDRVRSAADDPHRDPEVQRLEDKCASARNVLESIFENRMAKLLRYASTAAVADDGDHPDMTTEENRLYEVTLEAIRAAKGEALEGHAPAETDPSSGQPVDEGTDGEPGDRAASTEVDASTGTDDEADPGGDATAAGADGDEVETLMVRITADVGTILGVDEHEYELRSGDVVALPADNARALIERDVAVPASQP